VSIHAPSRPIAPRAIVRTAPKLSRGSAPTVTRTTSARPTTSATEAMVSGKNPADANER